MRKLLLFLAMLVGSAALAHGQGAPITGMALSLTGQPIPNPTVRVCLGTGSGTPCNPTVQLFSDQALTHLVQNPLPVCFVSGQQGCADAFGNYIAWASPQSVYEVQVSSRGQTTTTYVIGVGAGTGFNGQVGSTFQDAPEISTPANPVTPNDRLYLNNTTHLLSCITSTGISCMPVGNAFQNNLGGGYQDITEIATPALPLAGNERVFASITTHQLTCITSSGGNCNPTGGGGSSFYQNVQNAGAGLTQRPTLNFIGPGVSCADNSGSNRTDCTIPGGGGSGSGTVNSGSNYQIPAYGTSPSTTVGPSNLTTDATGNNLNVPGNIATGTNPPPCGTGVTGCISLVEASTPATPAANKDTLRADATNHCFEASFNGGAESCLGTGGGGGGLGFGLPPEIPIYNSTSNAVGDIRFQFVPKMAKGVANPTTVNQPFGWLKLRNQNSVTPFWPAETNACQLYYDPSSGTVKGVNSAGVNCMMPVSIPVANETPGTAYQCHITNGSVTSVWGGCSVVVAQFDQTGLTNNLGATTLYAVPANGAGIYQVSCYIVVTTAAGTSSTSPICSLSVTDEDTSATTNITLAFSNGNNTVGFNTCGPNSACTTVVRAKASTNMTLTTSSYASSPANAMTYAIHLKVVYLGP